MRSLLLGALLLLVPACLVYEIRVTTTMLPDGKTRRTLHIRCNEPQTWERLQPPGEPYSLEGDEQNGFVATARLHPGEHASGLRVLLGDRDEYGGAEQAMRIPAAEGTVGIRMSDVLIGTLYAYEEHVAIGDDPERFRAGAGKWLDLALRGLLEALKLKFPDTDFGPVEKQARAGLLPDCERAILDAHRACIALVTRWKAQAGTLDELGRAFLEAIAVQAAALGVKVAPPPGPPFEDSAVEAMFLDGWTQLLGRLLEPLPEAQRAAMVQELSRDGAFDDVVDEAIGKLFPDEAASDRAGEELVAWLADGFGAYAARGIFDSFHMRFRVELPGRLLRTNGDLGAGPVVEWRFDESHLVLVAPALFAYSFAPRDGAPGGIRDLGALREIESGLVAMPAEQRDALEAAVAAAIKSGWEESPALEGEAREVYGRLRAVVSGATDE